MAGSQDDYRDRRRRSASGSRDRNRDRRRDDDRRSSRRDSPRRRSSRSPSGRASVREERGRHQRQRREHSTSSVDEDRRRHRHRSHRHRDGRDHDRSSRKRRSPRPRSRSRRRSRSPPRALQRKGPLPSQSDAFNATEVTQSSDAPAPEKQKPNFNATGRLAAESNSVQVGGGETIVLKYHEPPEARKPPPKEPWRMYVFKGEELLEVVELGERSCWLIGRERQVVDFPLDHPSCSKQHAALQFRFVEKRNEFGDRIGKVKPYLIDLESANGSSVNGEPAPAGRYMEIMDKDVLRFGLSTREYVLMLPPS
ncbi:hypothetical protein NUU61_004761 [Penicillium alfredii]|uniref:FHA domain-containing protein n=1 Tax=Penicillium alfredii TaxID=1506179 RepID=A0A9W9F852_9EURO|nr:uncharacterized protein NUU61_004761 [Penicillium alfredii]KAJ5095405.1 hypothetical protein NUU61_004761 [Penicillium alfredii]